MSRHRFVRRFLIVVSVLYLGLFVSVPPAGGQAASTGTVVGIVTDPSGAVIPGATVTITDIATHDTRTSVTNDAGRYVFVNVTPSTYEIAASKKGFAVGRIAAQKVNVGAQTNANLQLPLGAATQTVEVQASGTDLQTMNATVGNTVTGVALQSLPSLGRDVSTFAVLQPGVSPDGSVAGAVLDQNSFMLDGGNNTNDMDGSMNQYTPSFSGDPSGGITFQTGNSNPNFGGFTVGQGQSGVPTGVMPTPADSIEEFKVNTNNQTADFNSSAGSEVRMVTKRGSDAWHGTVYEYYLDNNFSANTWDNNHTGVRQPDYHYNRFGAAIGGPIIPKNILGGKTYFFANYQGFRWPNSETIEKTVPSANMRAGILTFAGTSYNVAAFDPLGIGVNPLIKRLWAFEPPANDPGCGLSRCDGENVLGFKANLSIPQNDNFGVARLDHDFSPNWHWTASYRYYHLTRATHDQVDIGGFFPGDVIGVPKSLTNRPQVPWYLVTGMTTNISANTSNDFHFSYLRNYWAWQSREDPPQFPGLGGALELFGESRDNVLIPYNVNTQQTRTRFWDGHDWMFRDDISSLHGNHLLQFGGTYQRNWDYHQRTDNGGGINYQPVYQLGTTSGAGIDLTGFLPATLPASAVKNWGRDYAAMLGIVSVTQQAFTRTGSNLLLNPPHTPAFDRSTIRSYNVYFSDTWHMRPSFTLTYGLGWTLQMPPIEQDGKVVMLVDDNNQPIDTNAYLQSRARAALQGQVFNPNVGFALVGNAAGGARKYPYDPFYGAFSPRLAMAWNVTRNTVVRAGYSRIYGRLNGVDLVLLPLLGVGLIQPVQCIGAMANGACSPSATPATAFRIGANGLVAPLPAATSTLPQPTFPGVNDIATSAPSVLDSKFRPSSNDQFDLTIQRQVGRKTIVEVGYIGRLMRHELQPININAVPYMMTLGGQSFAKAYAAIQVATKFGSNMSAAVPPQPFFEAAMKPSFCAGFSSCTAAVVAAEANNIASQSVWNLWSDLDNGGFNFPRSMLNTPILGSTLGASGQTTGGIAVDTSLGHSNYHAGFVTMRMSDWHGFTMQQNFTWSKSLGTGAVPQATSQWTSVDAFNLNRGYGYQAWDRKFLYNVFFVYQPQVFKGQQGFLGRVLGGWTFAPIFSAGSGLPLQINTLNGDSQAFGEGDSLNFFSFENGVPTGSINFGNSRHSNVPGANGIGDGGFGVNLFGDPVAAFNSFRSPVLGLDEGHNGGAGILRGLPFWNMDLSIRKAFKLTERFSTEASVIFTNVLNHNQFADPILDLSNPSQWGVLTSQGNTPRQMEFGIRLNF